MDAWETLRRRLRFKVVRRLTGPQRASNATRLACIPGDDIGDAIIANGLYERDFLEAFFYFTSSRQAEFASGVVLDIGANIGNHTSSFSPRFAKVLAFEPNPLTFHLLQANILLNGLPNVEAFQVGLGSKDADLEYAQNAGHNLGASGFSDLHKEIGGQRMVLPVRNAGTFVDELLPSGSPPVRLVKVDVGPFSSEVLLGLQGLLERDQPVLICELIGPKSVTDRGLLEQIGYTHFYSLEYAPLKERTRLGRFINRMRNPNVRLVEVTPGRAADPLYDNVIATVGPIFKATAAG